MAVIVSRPPMTRTEIDLPRIRRLPLLDGASAETFALLTREAAIAHLEPGGLLAAQGESDDQLYLLLEGAILLEGAWNGREADLALLQPPATLMLAPAVLGGPNLVTARALSSSAVLAIPGQAVRQALGRDAGFGRAVAEELAGCFSGLVRTFKNHRLRGAQERLASYLLTQQQRQGGGPTLRLPCRKRRLASLLGMTPENLSRALASLVPYGVEIDGVQITLSEPLALARLAAPDPLIDNHVSSADGTGQAERERRRFVRMQLNPA